MRTVPLAGELTASLINRVADRYGLPAAGVLRLWTCRNSPTRHDGGRVRADAEVVLNEAGRRVLAELCGVEPQVLARALPAFTVEEPKISSGREAAVAQVRWRAAGAVAGPAAFACRLCTAGRTGQAVRAVRYAPRWGGSACGTGGGCWTRMPTSRWNTSMYAAWWRWWPRSGGGRVWRGVRCGPGLSRKRCSLWRMRWWPAGGSRPCTGSRRRSGRGGQNWEVRITVAGAPVGSLTAVRGLYWQSDNLRERMDDEQSFPALVAAQLLDEEGHFTDEFEEFIESASSVLGVDRLHLDEAFADPLVVAGVR